MTKRFIKSLALLLVLLLTAACFPAAAMAESAEKIPRRVESAKDAEEWIRVLLSDTPEALETDWEMTPRMRLSLALGGGMKSVAESMAASLGKIREIGSAYEDTLGGYRVFRVPCVFSSMSIDLVLALEEGTVAGLSTHPYTGGRAESAPSALFESRDLALPVPALGGELPGTLTLPAGEGPFPAVVLVHGSGPCDRDETMAAQKPFRDLAEGLAEKGVAVYRCDKRTYVYGAEMARDHGITLVDETVEDAAAAVQLLAAQEGIDPARIFVLGHSLGGTAIPAIHRALTALPVPAAGYILMAASPRPLEVLMREQYDFLLSLSGGGTPEQRAERDALFAQLDRLEDLSSLGEDDLIAGAYAPYWQWLADYDPAKLAAEIPLPCLVLQGEEDYQVTMEDYSLWQQALGDQENVRFLSFPGLTHCFTPGQRTEGAAAYTRPEKVDPAVPGEIAAFVLGN